MAALSIQELQDFHRFVGEQVQQGGAVLSPEEILDEWRKLHPVLEDLAEDLAAIQEAVEDIELGDRGVPFEEFDREFRARHNFPASS